MLFRITLFIRYTFVMASNRHPLRTCIAVCILFFGITLSFERGGLFDLFDHNPSFSVSSLPLPASTNLQSFCHDSKLVFHSADERIRSVNANCAIPFLPPFYGLSISAIHVFSPKRNGYPGSKENTALFRTCGVYSAKLIPKLALSF